MEPKFPSETSVHIQTTRRYIPEVGNNHNYRFENISPLNKKVLLVFPQIGCHQSFWSTTAPTLQWKGCVNIL
jgi:hypothetical protein